MRNFLAILFFCLQSILLSAQSDTTKQLVVRIEPPKFPGGEKAMSKFIAKNIKYPKDTVGCKPYFTVYVSFVVEKDGSVSSAYVFQNEAGNAAFGNESVRVVSSMPKWSPGTLKGSTVRVEFKIPIKYYLKADDPIVTLVDKPAKFPGGDKAKQKFIEKNIVYPTKANTEGRSGTCYIQAIVEKDGKLSGVKVSKEIKDAEDLNEEALRVVKMMPNWKPAKIKGKAVRTYVNIAVEFEGSKSF